MLSCLHPSDYILGSDVNTFLSGGYKKLSSLRCGAKNQRIFYYGRSRRNRSVLCLSAGQDMYVLL